MKCFLWLHAPRRATRFAPTVSAFSISGVFRIALRTYAFLRIQSASEGNSGGRPTKARFCVCNGERTSACVSRIPEMDTDTQKLVVLASRSATRGEIVEARNLLRDAELAASSDEDRLCSNEALLRFFLEQHKADDAARYATRQRRLLKRIIARGGEAAGLAFRLLIKNLYDFGPRTAARKSVLDRLHANLRLPEASQRAAMLMLESVVCAQFGLSSRLLRRIPKVIDLGDLDVLFEDGSVVHPAALVTYGLMRPNSRVHVTGAEELTRALVVYAHSYTRRAYTLIHTRGGKAFRLRYRDTPPCSSESPS